MTVLFLLTMLKLLSCDYNFRNIYIFFSFFLEIEKTSFCICRSDFFCRRNTLHSVGAVSVGLDVLFLTFVIFSFMVTF